MSTITLECILDHRKGDLKGISLFHYFSVFMSLSSVLTDYCYHYLVVIIINNQVLNESSNVRLIIYVF